MSENEKDLILTAEELDAIGEIMNISMGAAATAVSTMLEKQVTITTPHLEQNAFGNIDNSQVEPALIVKIKYTEGISGVNTTMLRRQDVQLILDILMGNDMPSDGDDFEFDDMSMSASCEVMNQMMGSSATALSEMMNMTVNISTPEAILVESTSEAAETFLEMRGDQPVVAISFNMAIKDVLDTTFVSFLPMDLAREIISRVNANSDELPEPEPTQLPPFVTNGQYVETPYEGMPMQEMPSMPMANPNEQMNGQPQNPTMQPQNPYNPSMEMPQNNMVQGQMAAPTQNMGMPPMQDMQMPNMQMPNMQNPAGVQNGYQNMGVAPQQGYPQGNYMGQPPNQGQYPPMNNNMDYNAGGYNNQGYNQGYNNQNNNPGTYNYPGHNQGYAQGGYVPEPVTVRKAEFPDFSQQSMKSASPSNSNMNLLMGVQLEISIVVGRARRKIKDIMDFGQGTVIELDKQTGAPAEIVVNGQLLAYGDVIVVGDNFGVRITEIVGSKELMDLLNNN